MGLKECGFPSCGEVFPGVGRKTYCSNPHSFHCSVCGEEDRIAAKYFATKAKGLCSTCRIKRGMETRRKTIESSLYICRFPGCLNEFSPRGSRSFFCSKEHLLDCLTCDESFLTRSRLSPEENCSDCLIALGRDKARKTNIERYGVEFISQVPEIKARVRKTTQERYGVDCVLQAAEVKEKIRKTVEERYGGASPNCSSEIKEKTRQTNLTRYGETNPSKSEEVKERTKKTNLERYGTTSPLHNEEIRAKSKKTSLLKYGEEIPMNSKVVRDKINEANIEKYGHPWALGSELIREKSRLTNLAKLGVEYPTQSEEVRQKVKKTVLSRYGVENVFQHEAIKQKSLETFHKNFREGLHSGGGKLSKLNRNFAKFFSESLDLKEEDISFEFPLAGKQFDLIVRNILVEINPTISHNSEKSFQCFKMNCKDRCSKHQPKISSYHREKSLTAFRGGFNLIHIFDWQGKGEILAKLEKAILLAELLPISFGEPILHWSRKKDEVKTLLTPTTYERGSRESLLMLNNGWLPVFDDGAVS